MTSARTAERLTRILSMLPWVLANPGAEAEEVLERFGYGDRAELVSDLNLVFVCGLPGYGPGDLMDAYLDEDEVVVDMADYFARSPRLSPAEALALLAAGMALVSSGQGSPALAQPTHQPARGWVLVPAAAHRARLSRLRSPRVGLRPRSTADRRSVRTSWCRPAGEPYPCTGSARARRPPRVGPQR